MSQAVDVAIGRFPETFSIPNTIDEPEYEEAVVNPKSRPAPKDQLQWEPRSCKLMNALLDA